MSNPEEDLIQHTVDQTLSAADQESQLMEFATRDFEKSASVAAPLVAKADPSDPSRLEERIADAPKSPEEAPDKGDLDETYNNSSESDWGPKPTVKNQVQKYPKSVRMRDPETKILNLAKAEDLEEYNRIQKGQADPEAPRFQITELEKQQFKGGWTVFITFARIEYFQL